jgi:hypothetical protein
MLFLSSLLLVLAAAALVPWAGRQETGGERRAEEQLGVAQAA